MDKEIKLGGTILSNRGNTTITNNAFHSASGTINTAFFEQWGIKQHLDTQVFDDRLEITYRQDSNITYTTSVWPCWGPSPRIFKEVYEIVDGKILLTKTVEGTYLPARDESYTFE